MYTEAIADAPTFSTSSLYHELDKIGVILKQNVEAEQQDRRISSEVLNALRNAGFLRLFLPKSLGGLEVDPLTAAKLVEEVGRNNTTAAWAMMVANTAIWWCNRLPDAGVEEIFSEGPDTFIAGAFHPPMKAKPVGNGFIINGRTPLASNVHE